jgi:hypothetical protein
MKSIWLILAVDNDIELYFKLAVAAIFVVVWAVKSVSNLAKPKSPPRAAPPLPPPLPRRTGNAGMASPPPLPRRIQTLGPLATPLAAPRPMARPPSLPPRLPWPPVSGAGLTPMRTPPGAFGRPAAQPAASVILPALAALAQPPRPKKRKKAAKPVTANAPQGLSAPLRSESVPEQPQTTVVSRSRVASWINAGTVRSEFLLAEALRPPLALRESHR